MQDQPHASRCLGCDKRLEAGQAFCLDCGGLAFARAPEGAFAVSVGPIASMDFRQQAARYVADLLPQLSEQALLKAFAGRAWVADSLDEQVGQALVARLKKIPAEARLQPNPQGPQAIGKRLLSPLALGLYGAGLLAGVLVSPWLLIVGLGAGVATAWRSAEAHMHALPPLLPPPPPALKALPALLPKLKGEDRERFDQVAQNSFALLKAAADQGLDVQVRQADGMGRAVAEVIDEAIALSQDAAQDDQAAREKMRALSDEVRAALDKLGGPQLAAPPRQALLEAAEIVNEVAEI